MFPLPWDQAEERKFPARQQTCWPANAVASLCKQHSGPSYSKAVNLSPKREKRPQAWREGVPPEDLGGRRDRSVARGRQLLPAPQQSSKPECIPTSDANGPPRTLPAHTSAPATAGWSRFNPLFSKTKTLLSPFLCQNRVQAMIIVMMAI